MSLTHKPIVWTDRYSTTMEDDDKGRWARVAYCGTLPHEVDLPADYKASRIAWFEIAWINKINPAQLREDLEDPPKFFVNLKIPSSRGSILAKTLEEAKEYVEIEFTHFMRFCSIQDKLSELSWWETIDKKNPFLIKLWSGMYGSDEQRISQLFIIKDNLNLTLLKDGNKNHREKSGKPSRKS